MTNKGGRPSIYSADIAREICERLAEGQSLLTIVRDEHMPCYATVINWARNDVGGFLAKYEKARISQADGDADRVTDIADKCMRGELDAAVARMAMDAHKWSAERRNPRKYGKIDATVVVDRRSVLDALDDSK